ncbi:hypothetical protein ACFLY8_02525 [Halobacteriota archaeon]
MLVRKDDMGNMLTDPIFYCPIGNLKRVISVMEGNAKTACDDFRILKKVIEPTEFKRVSKEGFMRVYLHMGVHRLMDDDYQRITIYQSTSETGVKNLTQLAETTHSVDWSIKSDKMKGLRFENDNRRIVLIIILSVLQ